MPTLPTVDNETRQALHQCLPKTLAGECGETYPLLPTPCLRRLHCTSRELTSLGGPPLHF